MAVTTIRQARVEDAVTLAKLGASSFMQAFAAANHPDDIQAYVDKAFKIEQIRTELNDAQCTFLLAEKGEALLGYAKLRRGETDSCITGQHPVELQRIYANPEYIGSGVGKALLLASMNQAREDQFATLWLGVWEDNAQAIAFYHHMGFETVGTKDFMMGQDRQTDLIMQWLLP